MRLELLNIGVTFALLLVLCPVHSIPSSYIIPNVPWDRQLTDYACGAGSLQMVFNYWFPDIPITQEQILDVARDSPQGGTFSLDIVRAGHFSTISYSDGRVFPNAEPMRGWPGRPIGMGGLWHDGEDWTTEIKQWIANDYPVIVLMEYSLNSTGGHFRVARGYDDEAGVLVLNDPWGRGGAAHVLNLTYSMFSQLWNYHEHNATRTAPFFGALLAPWKINYSIQKLSNSTVNITLSGTYVCGAPFNCSAAPVAKNTIVKVRVMSAALYLSGSPLVDSWDLGDLSAGQTTSSVSFLLSNYFTSGNQKMLLSDFSSSSIVVEMFGVISAPKYISYCCTPHSKYENYAGGVYTDIIGASAVLTPFASTQ